VLEPAVAWSDQIFEDPRGVRASSIVLVVCDRLNRCVWLLDPASGRLHDRIDGRSSSTMLFGAPAFALRVSPVTSFFDSNNNSSDNSDHIVFELMPEIPKHNHSISSKVNK
jgi:hypothetical protein